MLLFLGLAEHAEEFSSGFSAVTFNSLSLWKPSRFNCVNMSNGNWVNKVGNLGMMFLFCSVRGKNRELVFL